MTAIRAYFHPPTCLWGFEAYQRGAVIHRSEAIYLDELSAKFAGRKRYNLI